MFSYSHTYRFIDTLELPAITTLCQRRTEDEQGNASNKPRRK